MARVITLPTADVAKHKIELRPDTYQVHMPLSENFAAQGFSRWDGKQWHHWRLDYRIAQDEDKRSIALTDSRRGCFLIATEVN